MKPPEKQLPTPLRGTATEYGLGTTLVLSAMLSVGIVAATLAVTLVGPALAAFGPARMALAVAGAVAFVALALAGATKAMAEVTRRRRLRRSEGRTRRFCVPRVGVCLEV
ncbi:MULTISPECIES: hypothetical protein [Halorussus]|uniref:hypothetical protein n=1 Tax=Halorussus TaxID=1070314 RepID=UPI00209CF9B8|nr:hypothetical protein [Halorussus vallis]USZ74150.1 hypothetical protein NGM07_11880 [Halorussus vallis]